MRKIFPRLHNKSEEALGTETNGKIEPSHGLRFVHRTVHRSSDRVDPRRVIRAEEASQSPPRRRGIGAEPSRRSRFGSAARHDRACSLMFAESPCTWLFWK
ncbi:unnamed protein product [Nesidiocoris tenuis]|uniref:Uncharacterized protein n=1 Tax=Nesidiocoris tenuis TaxID=355587 RepID=A0A6H5HHW1_9HEMI|nr:unnamed protein product [Nesidiocoris tenuis]